MKTLLDISFNNLGQPNSTLGGIIIGEKTHHQHQSPRQVPIHFKPTKEADFWYETLF